MDMLILYSTPVGWDHQNLTEKGEKNTGIANRETFSRPNHVEVRGNWKIAPMAIRND